MDETKVVSIGDLPTASDIQGTDFFVMYRNGDTLSVSADVMQTYMGGADLPNGDEVSY